jgi:hypothetical protein
VFAWEYPLDGRNEVPCRYEIGDGLQGHGMFTIENMKPERRSAGR